MNITGVRGGAATCFFPLWHLEIENILHLKNEKGTEDNRVRRLDYGIQFNTFLYRRLLTDGYISLFSPNEVPDLYKAFFDDQEEFARLYEQYENCSSTLRQYSKIKAMDLFGTYATERAETGRYYWTNIDHINEYGKFKPKDAAVKLSNLCVAPETEILTRNGYVPIVDLENEYVDIWNGEEWSNVQILKTGENQELVTVETNNGHLLDCTEYHKFYIQKDGEIKEVRANELKPGDTLIDFNLPICVSGLYTMDSPYDNGSMAIKRANDNNTPVVPYQYDLRSRLEWLSGLLSSISGIDCAFFCDSYNKEFICDVQLLLQSLGIKSYFKSSIYHRHYTLTFRKYEIQKLDGLYKLRYDIGEWDYVDDKETIKILSVKNHGRISDTYCFTESKRGMGMFNGILTGQCLEITLPTKPLQYDRDPDGLIALCTLSAYNMGEYKNNDELEKTCYMMVRKLDELLDYQEYPVIAAEKHSELFRPLGIGVINYAYWLAKNGLTYNHTADNYQESLDRTHEFFEAFQYYLIKASIRLAKEKGPCKGYHMTKWSEGILPIDLYKKEVDELCNIDYNMDWESLRQDLLKYGIRNSTLTAFMPAETSAKISNATNGIEPVRGLVTYKGGKESLTAQVVPEIRKLKNKYDLLWDLQSPKGYIGLVAIMQKFVCQSISSNFSYNPHQAQYDGKVPASLLLQDQLYATKYGVRTGYYSNMYDGNEDDSEEEECESCKI